MPCWGRLDEPDPPVLPDLREGALLSNPLSVPEGTSSSSRLKFTTVPDIESEDVHVIDGNRV
jgi:hypothetical protein